MQNTVEKPESPVGTVQCNFHGGSLLSRTAGAFENTVPRNLIIAQKSAAVKSIQNLFDDTGHLYSNFRIICANHAGTVDGTEELCYNNAKAAPAAEA